MKDRITKRRLEAIPVPAEGRTRLYDDQLTGFGVVVHPTGRRSFFVEYGPERRRQRHTFGQFPALTVDQARTMAQAKLADIARGHNPVTAKTAQRAVPSVRSWVDEYLEAVRQRKKRPDHDELYLGAARKTWGGRSLDAVSRRDVELARAAIAKRGHTTANRWLASVRACFQEAVRQGLLTSNPAMGLRTLREAQPRRRVLTDEELAAVMDAVNAIEDAPVRAGFRLLLETGARLSEVLRARWADFDLQEGIWHLPSTKAGRKQTIPLSPETVRHLAKVPRLTEWVVPGRRKGEPRESLTGPWRIVKDQAGLVGVTIHDIRRTFGLHVTRTAGLHVASRLLRHSNVQITEKVYAPLEINDLRKAVVATQRKRGKVLKLQQAKGKKR